MNNLWNISYQSRIPILETNAIRAIRAHPDTVGFIFLKKAIRFIPTASFLCKISCKIRLNSVAEALSIETCLIEGEVGEGNDRF